MFWICCLLILPLPSFSINCEQFNDSNNIKNINWNDLKICLPAIGRNNVEKNFAGNIWRLIKETNDGIENISADVYRIMGNIIVGIPTDDLRNISMDQVEMIEAFSSIGGLASDQMNMIHDKVRNEWGTKTPERYSQYDLISLGQILCYFNRTEISAIHADAYKDAAEIIGKIRNCPHDIIQEFAKLAVQPEAFGPPSGWSKFIVSIVGNIITGLTPEEYSSINVENLRFNKRIYNQTKITAPRYNLNRTSTPNSLL